MFCSMEHRGYQCPISLEKMAISELSFSLKVIAECKHSTPVNSIMPDREWVLQK